MMVSSILIAAVNLLILYLLNRYRLLRQNLHAAKQSGLPYIIAP
jgi:hypothetical protein